MLPDRVVFQTNHPLKQAAAFPENDTCISTICVCGISITKTYGGTYAWVKAGFKVIRKLRKRKNINSIKIPLIIFEAEKDDMVDNCGIEKFAKKSQDRTAGKNEGFQT